MASIGADDATVEQFVAQGEGATGRAAADFVEQATSPRPVCSPSASSWTWKGSDPSSTTPRLAAIVALLRVFAHGTLANRAALATKERSPRSPRDRLKLGVPGAPPWRARPDAPLRRSVAALGSPVEVSSKTSSSTSASAPVSPAANSTSAARVSRCTRRGAPRYPTGERLRRAHLALDAWRENARRAFTARACEGSMGERRAGEGVSA